MYFTEGKDTFVALPTGHGKLIIFVVLQGGITPTLTVPLSTTAVKVKNSY